MKSLYTGIGIALYFVGLTIMSAYAVPFSARVAVLLLIAFGALVQVRGLRIP